MVIRHVLRSIKWRAIGQVMQNQRKPLLQLFAEWTFGREFEDREFYHRFCREAAMGLPIGGIVGYVIGMLIFFPEYLWEIG